jgi:hypothetical protein
MDALLSGRQDGRESHRCRYLKIRLRLCDSGLIHTHKYYRTACSMQSSSNQLKNLLRGLSPVFIVLGDWLPRLTMAWFRRLTSYNHTVLLYPHPMLVLEFEPPTPSITQVRAHTHSALEPLACLLDPPVCPIQPSNGTNHEWVALEVCRH